MKLSELKTGVTAYIEKVNGVGAFRKRINEMGIIPGSKIKAIKRAPFQDPIEYELMGYRISLRKNEAQLIDISIVDNSLPDEQFAGMIQTADCGDEQSHTDSQTIRVALVGNPNCGKTTLFNYTTNSREHVGNYSGVTVDKKSAVYVYEQYRIEITDLPGTYSMSEYSPEERYVREFLTDHRPDIVVNVIDGSNLERNLYLTTQLIDMNVKVVAALNMYDELTERGDSFDYESLGKMIGIPFVATVSSKGTGIRELFAKVVELYRGHSQTYRHFHINYGVDINSALASIKTELKKETLIVGQYHSQYLGIKLLEKDTYIRQLVKQYPSGEKILGVADREIRKLEVNNAENSEAVIANARYSFIRGALKETYTPHKGVADKGYRADRILTHKWFALPLFLLILGAMFQITFSLGGYPTEWIENGVGLLGEYLHSVMSDGILRDMLIDGVVAGVGGVFAFLPNIVLLFLFISLLEDSGYMARAAFIMDRLMHKVGLHGKSFIPMLMGFGCNVPAVLATRTLENRRDRLVTMLVIPFISCSARLPIYLLLISAFFVTNKGLILLSIYVFGILVAAISALLMSKIIFKGNEAPFVMELPPYRMPSARNTIRHTWTRSKQYIAKMGGVILIASILVWALSYFPREQNGAQAPIERSYIGQIGKVIEPVISPLGYDWKIGVSLVSGVAAKEIVVSTMGVLYQSEIQDEENTEALSAKMRQQPFGSAPYAPLTAYSLMIFILLYFPCMAVVAAIKKEAGIKWALFSVIYSTCAAWIVAFTINQIGGLFL